MQSVSESFMSWVEQASDNADGDFQAQACIQDLVSAAYNCGALSLQEWQYLLRRIGSNQG